MCPVYSNVAFCMIIWPASLMVGHFMWAVWGCLLSRCKGSLAHWNLPHSWHNSAQSSIGAGSSHSCERSGCFNWRSLTFNITVTCFRYIEGTDVHQRSHTSYTTPCNGVVSHGAQFGGLYDFADQHNVSKTYAVTIFTRRVVFYTCLASPSECSTCK